MIDFTCPQCDNHVRIDLAGMEEQPEIVALIEAWCCTRHPRPVRMTQTAPSTTPSTTPS